MAKQVFAISTQSARQLGLLATNPQGRKELSEVVEKRNLQTFHICKLTEAALAAGTDEVIPADAQLYNWTSHTSTGDVQNPGELVDTDLNTIVVWNPHNVEIPSGTLCFIAKGIAGWLLVSPINWCPAE